MRLLPDEGTTHPEAKRICSQLKKAGYRIGGRRAAMTLYYDKAFDFTGLCASGHRVYVNRYSGTWEAERLYSCAYFGKEQGIVYSAKSLPGTTGTSSLELNRHLTKVLRLIPILESDMAVVRQLKGEQQ